MVEADGAERPDVRNFELAMAFQPVVEVSTMRVYAYEALVRGPNGESAADMLAQVTPDTRYSFDQQCRVAAIEASVRAGIVQTTAKLAINFMPEVVEDPVDDSQRTLRAARDTGLSPERLMFEFSEHTEVDGQRLSDIIHAYRKLGFSTSFDDFGAGNTGLSLLSRFTPDAIKLDSKLVRGICGSWSRRLVVENLVRLANGLGVKVIAEGVESHAEFMKLRSLGVRYLQGYYIARPHVGRLPLPRLGANDAAAA